MASKILDEFNCDLHCGCCNKVTEHNVQKIDEEGNGEFIGYYGVCDICQDVREIEESELNQ